jgi:hypothetical protein
MATQSCNATIRSVSDISHVNVRSGPGTHTDILDTIPVGTAGLRVLEVQPDGRGVSIGGRVYQWLRLELPAGGTGWVRDDLVEIAGDCSIYGYGVLALPIRAANLTRTDTAVEDERERKAAFNITAGFEGGGYATFQTYDAGIISYGRFQCTLASGSLEQLLNLYLLRGSGFSADQLRAQFIERVRQKDLLLRDDEGFKTLLLRLARDPDMQEVQNEYATNAYWNPVLRGSMLPRGINTPLGQAFAFDTAIQHGNWGLERDYLRPAEQNLGAPIKSKLGENGLTEQQLIRRAAELRRDRLHALAEAKNLPGLIPRGDFWVRIIDQGDWDLQGDDLGDIEIKEGRRVQVRNP